jgi:hypothetical protein
MFATSGETGYGSVLHCEWQLLDLWLLAAKQDVVLAGELVLSAVGVLFLQWVLYDDCAWLWPLDWVYGALLCVSCVLQHCQQSPLRLTR